MGVGDMHVWPDRDIVDHNVEGDDCLCGPTTEAVECSNGSYGWVVIHHSLDGREKKESGL